MNGELPARRPRSSASPTQTTASRPTPVSPARGPARPGTTDARRARSGDPGALRSAARGATSGNPRAHRFASSTVRRRRRAHDCASGVVVALTIELATRESPAKPAGGRSGSWQTAPQPLGPADASSPPTDHAPRGGEMTKGIVPRCARRRMLAGDGAASTGRGADGLGRVLAGIAEVGPRDRELEHIRVGAGAAPTREHASGLPTLTLRRLRAMPSACGR